MDLEKFPTSPAAKRMLSYVTKGWYDNSYVGKWLYHVMGLEMDGAVELIESLPYQAFPETATWGLQYFEVLFGLPINPAGKTIEERRKEILKKRNMRAPLNPDKLAEYIYLTTGVKVHITENVRPYTFRVDFDDIDFAYSLQKLYEEIRNIKPSHLSFMYGLKFEIQNREGIDVSKIRIRMQVPWIGYEYYLDGSWLLDGSVLLGYRDFNPMKIRIRSQAAAAGKNSAKLLISARIGVSEKMCLGMAAKIADTALQERYSIPKIRVQTENRGKITNPASLQVTAAVQNREMVAASATEYLYWRLDGRYALDGSKLLGPDIMKEEL